MKYYLAEGNCTLYTTIDAALNFAESVFAKSGQHIAVEEYAESDIPGELEYTGTRLTYDGEYWNL